MKRKRSFLAFISRADYWFLLLVTVLCGVPVFVVYHTRSVQVVSYVQGLIWIFFLLLVLMPAYRAWKNECRHE
jgi:uncharacterized membrane protein YhaH (DUF805 family)